MKSGKTPEAGESDSENSTGVGISRATASQADSRIRNGSRVNLGQGSGKMSRGRCVKRHKSIVDSGARLIQ